MAQRCSSGNVRVISFFRSRATVPSSETASFAAGRADLVDVIAAKSALALLELEILEREQMAVEAAATLRLTYGEDRP